MTRETTVKTVSALVLSVCVCAGSVLAACSGDFGAPIPGGQGSRTADAAAQEAKANRPDAMSYVIDAATSFRSDAFFINDPAPPMCGPDGKMTPAPKLEGSADCPKDKNREGCACPEAGKEAACWPGKRINRNHGICGDGKTRCGQTPEFGLAWGSCQGYVLPKEGALQGPDACLCFSKGKWELSNLVPCIVEDTENNTTYLYSSSPDARGGYSCGSVSVAQLPQTAPTEIWSTSRLNVDCAGQFELCYTLKAGKATVPNANDCTLTRQCFDVWYDEAGRPQNLPDLSGWVAPDTSCAARFKSVGGYGEMSVRGRSEECEAVDDGNGKAYVFERTTYCKPDCNQTPDAEECRDCSVSGAGDF
jgi:hypothetical protein